MWAGWFAAAMSVPARASPMSEAAAQLACGDEPAATGALERLSAAATARFGVPDESLGGDDATLASAAIDSLLDALGNARQRFPHLAPAIDALVAKWDFCALTSGELRWDLLGDGPLVQQQAPALLSPMAGRGFAAWSLLPRSADGRPRWDARRAEPPETLPPQCQRERFTTPHGSLPALPAPAHLIDDACQGPPPPVPQPSAAAPPVAPLRPAAKPVKKQPIASKPREVPQVHEVASSSTRDGISPLPGTVSMSATLSATGRLGTGLGISLAPRTNTFVRAGLGWGITSKWQAAFDPEPSWSWGFGYDDWRTGTVSAQLNHWGPLRRLPSRSELANATAALGYKVPLGERLGKHLSLRVDLTTPLTWSPALGVGVSLKLPAHCFASLGVSQKLLEATRPSWTYVVGRSLWKPKTLSIILANYGPNSVPKANLRNFVLSLSWSWKL